MIVSAMPDPNGVNLKDRPSVVVTPTAEITPEKDLLWWLLSRSLLPGPVPVDHVELPWDPLARTPSHRPANSLQGGRTLDSRRFPQSELSDPLELFRGKQLELIAAKLTDLMDQR